VKKSNCAAKSLFAWETGRVIDTQSPFGEVTVDVRLFADANALKAETVSGEGWTKALTWRIISYDVNETEVQTSSIEIHCRKSGLPGVEIDLSFSSKPTTLFEVNATRRVIISLARAAPWRMNPAGAAARLSCRIIDPADAPITDRTAMNVRKAMAGDTQ
jgi:hypothetical protein